MDLENIDRILDNLEYLTTKIPEIPYEGWINEKMNSNEKIVWIITDDDKELSEQFSGNPKKDIIILYKKIYQIDVSDYEIIYLLLHKESSKIVFPDAYKHFPFLTISTQNQENIKPIPLKNHDILELSEMIAI